MKRGNYKKHASSLHSGICANSMKPKRCDKVLPYIMPIALPCSRIHVRDFVFFAFTTFTEEGDHL